ncbi:hypothetical protein BJX96DRAFT_150976 [Aspergillus floccosus]
MATRNPIEPVTFHRRSHPSAPPAANDRPCVSTQPTGVVVTRACARADNTDVAFVTKAFRRAAHARKLPIPRLSRATLTTIPPSLLSLPLSAPRRHAAGYTDWTHWACQLRPPSSMRCHSHGSGGGSIVCVTLAGIPAPSRIPGLRVPEYGSPGGDGRSTGSAKEIDILRDLGGRLSGNAFSV